MKAINCTTCRKRIHEEEKNEFLKHEYAVLTDSAQTMATYAICGVLAAMIRQGRTAQYIKKMYDEMCIVFNTPEIFGKEITLPDVMKRMQEEYGIDWSKLNINIESESQYIREVKEAGRNT